MFRSGLRSRRVFLPLRIAPEIAYFIACCSVHRKPSMLEQGVRHFRVGRSLAAF
jgi:hypothetical protein